MKKTKKQPKKKPAKKKKRGGRTPKYRAEYAAQAKALRSEYGVSVVDLAATWKVSKSIIYKWIEDHPKFAEAMQEGKVYTPGAIKKVKKALLKRALGYKFREVTSEPALLIKVKGKKAKGVEGATVEDIEMSMVPTKVVTKEVPPDVSAQREILHNKCPEEFKDRQEIGGIGGGPINLSIVDFSKIK